MSALGQEDVCIATSKVAKGHQRTSETLWRSCREFIPGRCSQRRDPEV